MKKISVIFAGMAGSGKSTIARNTAKIFKLDYLCGGDALQEMAREQGFKPSGDGWWETKEGMEFLALRDKDPQFDKRVDKFLIEHVKKGGVSITSWAVPWLTKHGFKVYLKASQDERARRISGRDNITYQESLAAVKKRDIENTKLYKSLYGHNIVRDLEPFDLVINTDMFGIYQVTEIVKTAIQHMSRKA
jgi:cytidylate kinase